MSAGEYAMTAPSPCAEPTLTRGGPTHVVCCDETYPYALCGTDVSSEPWMPEDTQVDCDGCAEREFETCERVCPKRLFGPVGQVSP
jgi:hypothetical protein